MSESHHSDAEALLREIEATRERIAGTAAALAYRADMPMRVRERVREKLALASASAKPYAARFRSIAIDAAAIGRLALVRASNGDLRKAIAMRLPNRPRVMLERGDQFGFALGALGAGFVIGLLLPGKARSR